MIILIGVFMVNSAKSEATYQSTLNSPLPTSQSEIPLKALGPPSMIQEDSTLHLRFAAMPEHDNFVISDENENGQVTLP